MVQERGIHTNEEDINFVSISKKGMEEGIAKGEGIGESWKVIKTKIERDLIQDERMCKPKCKRTQLVKAQLERRIGTLTQKP